MTASSGPFWGNQIIVTEIGGIRYKMYRDRPHRIGDLLEFADGWGARPYVLQGDRVLPFSVMRRASAAKARYLLDQGVAPRDHVFILGWNSPDWVVNFWACVQIGAVPVACNSWWGEGELEHALQTLRPTLTLADASATKRLPMGWKIGRWEASEQIAPNAPVDAGLGSGSQDENEPAAIIFTSGTEGRAKAVVLAHRSLLAQLQMMLHITRRLPYRPSEMMGEVCLHTGPLFHIGGVHALLRGVVAGNTLVMLRGRFDPAEAIELIETHRIARWNAVPTMATRVLEHPDVRQRDLTSLRTITLGGSAVHPELMDRIRTSLPGSRTRVATGYGLSENAGQATAAGGADTVDRAGSCGRPLPCVEVRIVPRAGLPDGEVLLRSPTQMLGYYGASDSPIDTEGWLHTGDLGRIDSDGHLWITGRCKDIIIRGGENISPAAVERALVALPGVSEACVFGVPHPELGEEVMAVVVVEGEQTPEQLCEQVRTSVASFAVPSRWQLRRTPLPVNQTGKVDKAAVVAASRRELAHAGTIAAPR